MQFAHLPNEPLLGRAHVEQGLAGLGLLEEHDEINGMTCTQGNADLRIVLEAADAGTVPGARIDDQVRALLHVDYDPLRRPDR
jgi:hypothetical protein